MKKQIKSFAIIIIAALMINNQEVIANSDVANQMCGEAISLEELIKQNAIHESTIQKLRDENQALKEENVELKEKNATLIYDNELNKQLENLTNNEWELLYRVATAEAGYQSAAAQKNVVWVVLNRVDSENFPNTIAEVISATGQFATYPKAMKSVEVTEFTIQNVQEAYLEYFICDCDGEIAEGALFFCKGKFPYKYLFTDEVGHNFYK